MESFLKNAFPVGVDVKLFVWTFIFFILMDYPIYIGAISMELSIMYFKGL